MKLGVAVGVSEVGSAVLAVGIPVAPAAIGDGVGGVGDLVGVRVGNGVGDGVGDGEEGVGVDTGASCHIHAMTGSSANFHHHARMVLHMPAYCAVVVQPQAEAVANMISCAPSVLIVLFRVPFYTVSKGSVVTSTANAGATKIDRPVKCQLFCQLVIITTRRKIFLILVHHLT